MILTLPAFNNGATIPYEYAYCIPAAQGGIQKGKNINPQMVWSHLPDGTQSLAIIVVDPDVPTDRSKANREGAVIAKNTPRTNFYHMVLVDIPLSVPEIKAGQDSPGTGEKKPGPTAYGVRGANDYSPTNGGYDGPCPPWNDELIHHYHFRLYALNVKTLGLSGNFDGRKAMNALQGHIVAQSEWVGTYTLNPNLNK